MTGPAPTSPAAGTARRQLLVTACQTVGRHIPRMYRRRLFETEERRRETKAGYPTRKECQPAMAKVLVAVEESSYVAPTTITEREFLQKEWLPLPPQEGQLSFG